MVITPPVEIIPPMPQTPTAIELSYTNGTGLTANYWRVSSFFVDPDNQRSLVIIDIYSSQVGYTEGNSPFDTRSYEWNGDDFPFSDAALQSATPLSIIYNKLLALPAFAGATSL